MKSALFAIALVASLVGAAPAEAGFKSKFLKVITLGIAGGDKQEQESPPPPRYEGRDRHNTIDVYADTSYNSSSFRDFGDNGCQVQARAWRNNDGEVKLKIRTSFCSDIDQTASGYRFDLGRLPAVSGRSNYNYEGTVAVRGSFYQHGKLRFRLASPQGNYTTIIYLHY